MENELHILVIDDDPDMLRVMRGYLKDYYKVTLISSPKEALTFLDKNKPNAILLDYLMPEMNGLELLNVIKNNDELKNIPVFMLTAISDSDKIKDFMKMAQGYVQKPVSKRELLSVLNNYFE
ncbi:MAG: response regulator [Clostridia bacterium]|nr:response regulator [Clostridia bacterium]